MCACVRSLFLYAWDRWLEEAWDKWLLQQRQKKRRCVLACMHIHWYLRMYAMLMMRTLPALHTGKHCGVHASCQMHVVGV